MSAKHIAYLVMREVDSLDPYESPDIDPIAIHEHLEDAEDMVGKYNQDMKERGLETINFYVIAVPFYD